MRKISVSWVVIWLLFASGAVSAQVAATNFAGNWEMNIAKSKLPERARVEAMLMIVSQTDKELTVETVARRAASGEMSARSNAAGGMRPDGNPAARRGDIGNNGGEVINSPGLLTYNLAGETVVVQSDAPVGTPSSALTLDAYFEKDGKLKLNQSSKITARSGEYVIKTNDTWELSADGKTLKVIRETATPRGSRTAELYFVKTDAAGLSGDAMPAGISNTGLSTTTLAEVNGETRGAVKSVPDKSMSGIVVPQKVISGGVLNSKALQLPKPPYPAAARPAKAKGAVNVQVTVNESGNVVAAAAVSGHPLLRAAAVEAARGAKFAPVLVQGIPVKVTGVIVYNFVP